MAAVGLGFVRVLRSKCGLSGMFLMVKVVLGGWDCGLKEYKLMFVAYLSGLCWVAAVGSGLCDCCAVIVGCWACF